MRKCNYCEGACDWSRCECPCHDADDTAYELAKDREMEDRSLAFDPDPQGDY